MTELPRVFVKPGEGVKVPLPIPGGQGLVPKEGREVVRDLNVERLLRTRDLVEAKPPKDDAAASAKKEG